MKKIGFIKILQVACLLMLAFVTRAQAQVVTYYHNDALGSPVAATDDFGNLMWRENYAPFGEKIDDPNEAGGDHMGYTGKSDEKITGFTYMNARYYDPIVGRFMAVDGVNFIIGGRQYFNRYSYAINNPYKYTDPSGNNLALKVTAQVVKDPVRAYKLSVRALQNAKLAMSGVASVEDSSAVFSEEEDGNSDAPDIGGDTVDGLIGSATENPKDKKANDRKRGREAKGKLKGGSINLESGTDISDRGSAFDAANDAFDGLVADPGVKNGEKPSKDGKIRSKTVNGREVKVRERSGEGRPTVEIGPAEGSNLGTEVRYGNESLSNTYE